MTEPIQEAKRLAATMLEAGLTWPGAHSNSPIGRISTILAEYIANHYQANVAIRIIAVPFDHILKDRASVLMTRVVGDGLSADIFVHRHASKHLALLCVLVEFFHLLLVVQGASPLPTGKDIEDAANLFAWTIAKELQERTSSPEHVFFPVGLFESALNDIRTNIDATSLSSRHIEQTLDPSRHGN